MSAEVTGGSTCHKLSPDYTAYALGILGDPERAGITGHLAGKCPACTPGVAGALAMVTAMSGAVPVSEPPPRLRRRVIAMVGGEPARSWATWIPWALAGALALTVLWVSLPARGRQNGNTAKLEQALSIMNDPATRDVSFGETQKPSRGRVFVSPVRGVVFIGASLPRLPSGKTFELWVIPGGGNPIPAGTFSEEADATAVYVRPGPLGSNTAAVAVTIEPEGGSAQPTTKPFIVAGLS